MFYGVIFIMNASTLETTQSTQFTRTQNKCVNIHKFESCLVWFGSLDDFVVFAYDLIIVVL